MKLTFASPVLLILYVVAVYYVCISVKELRKLSRYKKRGIPAVGTLVKVDAYDNSLVKIHMTYPCEGMYCDGVCDELVTYSKEEAGEKFVPGEYYDILVDPEDHGVFIPVEDIKRSRKWYIIAIPGCILLSAVCFWLFAVGIRLPFDFLN